MATVVMRTQHINKLYDTYVVDFGVNSWVYYGECLLKAERYRTVQAALY